MEKPTAGVVEVQHIPPKSTWAAVLHLIDTNPEISSLLDRNKKDALYLMMKMKHGSSGKMQLCMNTLYSDYQRALSSGRSFESRACRSHLNTCFCFLFFTSAIVYFRIAIYLLGSLNVLEMACFGYRKGSITVFGCPIVCQ